MPGILNARAARGKFAFHSEPPGAALAPFVAHYWFVEWDLRGQEPHEQHVLPYPSVNVTFTRFASGDRCRVAGVPRGRFSELLRDKGHVAGVRFRPGGFRPFLGRAVSTITDRFLPIEQVFDVDGRAVLQAGRAGAVTLLEDFFAARVPAQPDPLVPSAIRIAEGIAGDPGLTRVDELAARSGMGMRRLQRLFAEYVGVGPKWVIRRYRLHEAAARAAEGTAVDWVRLASDLGYSDQSHLTRDFTAITGTPPARYSSKQTHSGEPARSH